MMLNQNSSANERDSSEELSDIRGLGASSHEESKEENNEHKNSTRNEFGQQMNFSVKNRPSKPVINKNYFFQLANQSVEILDSGMSFQNEN